MEASGRKIRLAISTCPNDTFAFHGILKNKVDLLGLEFEIELLDIQQLNAGLFAGDFDVCKASFHAAALLSSEIKVLPSGAALGFGVGPLLLAAEPDTHPMQAPDGPTVTLCPGEHTTASMLFRMFYGAAIEQGNTEVAQTLFSTIMPDLQTRAADFGVCIHEGRFTWEEEGLFLIEDLGTRWESETGAPLPLGGILVRRTLCDTLVGKVQSVIQSSILYGLENRNETLETMRNHAQELNDEVLFSHVDLYVNQWTVELGERGARALEILSTKARKSGMLGEDQPSIEVWQQR
ncbi:MAG: 1,4-dihydroxy-6-naphthoate synthase [Mariniblastus sp.]|nr:1,4-dihydroxy-6-naphthoate synthase [Mariniblastus sp.]